MSRRDSKPPSTGFSCFEKAYALGDTRIEKGFCWPMTEVGEEILSLVSIIKEKLKGGRILDLGCGEGRISIFLAQHSFECYGIDYVPLAIKRAKQFAKKQGVAGKTHFRTGNVLNLPYPDDFFDIAIDYSCFAHIRKSEWDLYISELLRVLKMGSFYFLAAFSKNTPHARMMKHNWLVFRGGYDHYFTRSEIRSIFSDHFEIMRIGEITRHAPPSPEFRFHEVLMKRIGKTDGNAGV